MILINSFIYFYGGEVLPLKSSVTSRLAQRGQSQQETTLAPGANCFFMFPGKLNLDGFPDMPPSSCQNHDPIDKFIYFIKSIQYCTLLYIDPPAVKFQYFSQHSLKFKDNAFYYKKI